MAPIRLESGALLNGRYRIRRTLGQGGMGTVYEAIHERLNSAVAVKEIVGDEADATQLALSMQQFEQEAQILVRLNHANLPRVTDAFVEGPRGYLVMELVEGQTLEARLAASQNRKLAPELVVAWGVQISEVLWYLHIQDPPIIFRDLKPANIMLQPDGAIKLIDFGIARRFQPGASRDTELLGSVGFSPPEQFGKQQTDSRSDIYSFGATLHYLLTGIDPAHSPFRFTPITKLVPGASQALSDLISSCVFLEPAQRPQSAAIVRDALVAVQSELHQMPFSPSPSPLLPLAARPTDNSRQSRGALGVAIPILGIALIVAAAVGVHSIRTPKQFHKTQPPGLVSPNSVSKSGSGALETPPQPLQNVGPQSSGTESPSPASAASSADVTASSGAAIKQEFAGLTDDSRAFRIHVTGSIKGSKDSVGVVTAFFYSASGEPIIPHDAAPGFTSSGGQLCTTSNFAIDSDPKDIDVWLEIPVEQFGVAANLSCRCILYSDNVSRAQTPIQPLGAD